jgi:acetyl esterase/lipase
MASRQAQALADLYAYWARRLEASNEQGFDLVRDLYNNWGAYATEAEGVSYLTADADGVPGIWAIPASPKPHSVLLYLHGGGFIGGGSTGHRKLAGHIARAARRKTLVVDYRLAPEHLYPAALEDSQRAYEWLRGQGYEAGRIGLVGDSAGGLLATRIAIALAETGQPQAGAVVALSPYYDLEAIGESFERNGAKDLIASRAGIAENAAAFLAEGVSRADPSVNALNADLSGLPPVFISFGGDEALMDGGQMFAERARAKGVEVEEEVVPGTQHVPQFLVGYAPEADESVAAIGRFLSKHLAG